MFIIKPFYYSVVIHAHVPPFFQSALRRNKLMNYMQSSPAHHLISGGGAGVGVEGALESALGGH